MKKIIMVSACLLGVKCRYDGSAKELPELIAKLADYEVVAFCPECSGGLMIPRLPAEIQGTDGQAVLEGKATVVMRDGSDCTAQFLHGASETLRLYQTKQPELVILKANSPSCGVGAIYDGTFRGILKSGDGVTAALLKQHCAVLYNEAQVIAREIFL